MEMLGLYLSIPFCRSKCTFCNFASGVFPASYMEQYVARLEADLAAARLRATEWGARLPEVVDSVYFGGGTPSLLPGDLVRRGMGAIRRGFAGGAIAGVTFEAAPAQFTGEKPGGMAGWGGDPGGPGGAIAPDGGLKYASYYAPLVQDDDKETER